MKLSWNINHCSCVWYENSSSLYVFWFIISENLQGQLSSYAVNESSLYPFSFSSSFLSFFFLSFRLSFFLFLSLSHFFKSNFCYGFDLFLSISFHFSKSRFYCYCCCGCCCCVYDLLTRTAQTLKTSQLKTRVYLNDSLSTWVCAQIPMLLFDC